MTVCVCAQLLNCVRLFETPWTVARQAPLSMRSSRQEYWSGLPFPSPGDTTNGLKPKQKTAQRLPQASQGLQALQGYLPTASIVSGGGCLQCPAEAGIGSQPTWV